LFPREAPVAVGPALSDLVPRDCSAASQEDGHCVRAAHLDGSSRDGRSVSADWAQPQDESSPADCPADSCQDDRFVVLLADDRSWRVPRPGGSLPGGFVPADSADYSPEVEELPRAGYSADSCRDDPWAVLLEDGRFSAEPRPARSVRVDSADYSTALLAEHLSPADHSADSCRDDRSGGMAPADSVVRDSPLDARSEAADWPVGSQAAGCRPVEKYSAGCRTGSGDALHSGLPLSQSLVCREGLV
jgi:hypothetical protein